MRPAVKVELLDTLPSKASSEEGAAQQQIGSQQLYQARVIQITTVRSSVRSQQHGNDSTDHMPSPAIHSPAPRPRTAASSCRRTPFRLPH